MEVTKPVTESALNRIRKERCPKYCGAGVEIVIEDEHWIDGIGYVPCECPSSEQLVEELAGRLAEARKEEREQCALIVELAYREYDGYGKDPKTDACRTVLAQIIRSGHVIPASSVPMLSRDCRAQKENTDGKD